MFLRKMKSNIMTALGLGRIFWSSKDPNVDIEWIEINAVNKRISDDYVIPKRIWIYWDSETLPEIVLICIDKIKVTCPEYELTVLNKHNVSEFIELPEVDDSLPIAIFADLVRLTLLDTYGGIWMDASIFINDDFDWIFSKLNYHDAFLFYSDECTINKMSPISENWFIICPKGSLFISEWLSEFKRCITSESPTTYYNNVKSNRELIQNLTKPDYLLCYISAIVVLNRCKFNILYASSGSVGHYYSYKHRFNGILIASEFLIRNKNKLTNQKLVKLTSGSRNAATKFINKGLYLKSSLLGCELGKKH